jgi:predicted nucleotidyltransferase
MAKIYSIDEIKKKVSVLASRYGAERIYLFGSYARGEAKEGSDIDFRIDKGKIRGLSLAGLLVDIEESLKIPVDLLTTNSLDKKFLENIKKDEVLIYESE